MIKTLYTENVSHLLMNGHLSLPIAILRGVRQGCPLSALLYILVAETLAEGIRQDVNIIGIDTPRTTERTKISQYADDANLFLRGINSVRNAFNVIKRFEGASGSKLNKNKTKGFLLGPDFGTYNQNTPHPLEQDELP